MNVTIAVDQSTLGETNLTSDQLQEAVGNALRKLDCPLNGNPIFFNSVQVSVEVRSPASGQTFVCLDSTKTIATIQDMQERISLLSGEMDANEEENRFMQIEIDTLYAKIDAQKVASN